MKIGVIYNPFAGSNKGYTGRRRVLKQILGNRGVIRQTRSPEDLEPTIREFYDEKIDILAVSGGDGTTHSTMTTCLKVYNGTPIPVTALLRGGTMNLLEASLGFKGTPEKRLKKVIEVLDHAEKNGSKFPVIGHEFLKVNDNYGFIFGIGLISNFMKEYYHGSPPGVLKAASMFGKCFYSAITGGRYILKLSLPVRARVWVDGMLLPEHRFTAIMAATERECGFGFKPLYRAREKEGHLHFLATNESPFALACNLHRIRSGRPIKLKSLYDIIANKVTIEIQKPYVYTVDGEMLKATKKVEISAGPRAKIIAV